MKPLVVFKTVSFPTFSETFIGSNITEAIDAGFDVKIIVDTINASDNTSQPDLLAKYGLLDKVLRFEQPRGKINRYIKAASHLLNPLLLYCFIKYSIFKGKKSLDYIFILKFYWKFRNAAAYHVHFATVIHPLFELKEIGFIKSKIVVTFHGYDAHFLPNGEQLKNLICNFNNHVAQITVNSVFLKNLLVSKGFRESEISIVPIGINTEFFKRDILSIASKATLKLITVGRLVALKGQEYGLRALNILIDKGFSVHYTIVGTGSELAKLMDLTKQLKMETHVTFEGNRNQQEIKELLQEHQVFLMTSTINEAGTREAFGVVSLEAQAMGLPVVGFQSGGFPETVIEGKTGFIVEDQNVAAMANAIEKLILDENLWHTMSENAKYHILNSYTFEKTIGQYLKFYE